MLQGNGQWAVLVFLYSAALRLAMGSVDPSVQHRTAVGTGVFQTLYTARGEWTVGLLLYTTALQGAAGSAYPL